MNRRWLFVVPAVVLAVAVWHGLAGGRAAAPMDLAALKSEFNAAAGRTRLIVLFSPT